MAETDATLQLVFDDNLRDNQIGGEIDGISPEVAEDLGYTAVGDVPRILVQAETTRRIELLEDMLDEAETVTQAKPSDNRPNRKLTSAEQNVNERRYIAAHNARVTKQVLPGQHF